MCECTISFNQSIVLVVRARTSPTEGSCKRGEVHRLCPLKEDARTGLVFTSLRAVILMSVCLQTRRRISSEA